MPLEITRHSKRIWFVVRWGGSRLCHVVRAFLDLLLNVGFRIVEFAHAAAQSTHQLRNFFTTKHEQDDDENDDDLIGAQHSQQEILYHIEKLCPKYSNNPGAGANKKPRANRGLTN